MDEQNWRTDVTWLDYVGHQRKKNQVSDRRPVIRKASDLVGPGINSSATVVTDWNNALATFNGYFSSVRALNGPRPETSGPDDDYDIHPYTGYVVMDATYGGKQVITDLDTMIDYSRIFRRAPYDPSTIVWGAWTSSSSAPPSAYAASSVNTSVGIGVDVPLKCPVLGGSNWDTTYAQDGTTFRILAPGVYTGVLRVSSFISPYTANLAVVLPKGLSTETINYLSQSLTGGSGGPGARIPFTFTSLLATSAITITAYRTSGSTGDAQWSGLDITRVGGVL